MPGMVLVDSNVILDVLTDDPAWFSWSSQKLALFADRGLLAINLIIYAEISVGFNKIADLESLFRPDFSRNSISLGKPLFSPENVFKNTENERELAGPLHLTFISAPMRPSSKSLS